MLTKKLCAKTFSEQIKKYWWALRFNAGNDFNMQRLLKIKSKRNGRCFNVECWKSFFNELMFT